MKKKGKRVVNATTSSGGSALDSMTEKEYHFSRLGRKGKDLSGATVKQAKMPAKWGTGRFGRSI